MKFTRSTILLYMALVFGSGALLGALGQRFYTATVVKANAKQPANSSDEFRKRYMAENTSRLHLSDEQIKKWELILDETRAQTHQAYKDLDPEIARIRNVQIEIIRQMLTPMQRAEYDKLRAEREERAKKKNNANKENRPGPGF